MKKILYIAKISILILFTLFTSGCYTIINPPEDYSDYQNNDSHSKSDTLNVDGNYTVINNYESNDQEACCNYGDCHDWPCSGHYHGHHQGHHYGHYHGYGYFYHGHHHHYYDNSYHYGHHDGYWWGYEDGYDDGWNDNEDYNNDYGNSSNNTIERRENSYNPEQEDSEIAQDENYEENDEETNDSTSNDIISIEKDLIIEPSIPNENSDNSENSPYERKYNVNDNSSPVINYESILQEDKKVKHKTRNRNSAAFDIAKIIITSISNSKKSKSDKSSISKSKNKKKDKSSTKKNKKNDKPTSNSKKSSKKSSNEKHAI